MSEQPTRRRRLGIAAAILYGIVCALLVFPLNVPNGVPGQAGSEIDDRVSCGSPIVVWAKPDTEECRTGSYRRIAHAGLVMLFELPIVVLYLAAAAAPRATD